MASLINIARIPVVVGILKNEVGEFLVAKRPAQSISGGFWEFPGGKVEAGETHEVALRREIKEEVGVDVLVATPFFNTHYDGSTRLIALEFWHVTEFEGQAFGAEGQEIRWVLFKTLASLKMLPANAQVMEKLRKL